MNNDDLPPISPERWRDKFTSVSKDFNIVSAPPEVPEVLEQLRIGKISPATAEAQFVKLGFSPRSAQLTVEDHLKDWSQPKDDKRQQ